MIIHTLIALSLSLSSTALFCSKNPASVAIQVGSAKGLILSDGPVNIPPRIFTNVNQQAVLRSYRENFVNATQIQQNILLLDLPAGRTLFETGSLAASQTNQPQAGLLIPLLRENGISPESIERIVVTHGHGTRIGSLLTADGELAFPNAILYVDRTEHEFWTTDPIPTNPLNEPFLPVFANAYRNLVLPYLRAGKLRLVRRGGQPFQGVRFVPAPGHTPGHVHFKITVDDEQLFISGDSWITRGDQVRHPEWETFIETNASDAYTSRIELLEDAANGRVPVLVFHEDFPGLGFVRKVADAFDFVAIPLPNIDADVSRKCTY